MKNFFNTVKGRAKRNSVDVSKSDSGTFQQQVSSEGSKEQRHSAEESSQAKGGGGLLDKMKHGLVGRSQSNSPYISDDDGTVDAPVVQINANRYGLTDGDDEEQEQASSAPLAAPPQIKVMAPPPEVPYVEDDPTLKVIKMCRATYDYDAQEETEIDFVAGDRIAVYSYQPERWGKGRNVRTGKRGEFPCNRTTVDTEPEIGAAAPVNPQMQRVNAERGSFVASSPQVQRIAVDRNSAVGSPQVQRLSFFDNLNQDIAYREAKAKEQQDRMSGRTSPGNVQVIQQIPAYQQPVHQQPPPQLHVEQSHQPSYQEPVGHAPTPAAEPHRPAPPVPAGTKGKKKVPRKMPPGPGPHRGALPAHLSPRSGMGGGGGMRAPPPGPTITRIVPTEEEYPEDERGTE